MQFHVFLFENVILPRIKPPSNFLVSAIYMDSRWNQKKIIKWKRFQMCALTLFPDLSLWLRPTDIVHTQIILGAGVMEALLRARDAAQWRGCGQSQCDSSPFQGQACQALHKSWVIVMHLRPRQHSRLPLWEALWLRPSVAFLQQTINGSANSSQAWFQAPMDGLNLVLAHRISWTSPPSSILTSFTAAKFLRISLKIKILDVKKQHFGVIVDNACGVTIHIISEGKEGMNAQRLFLQCFFLLAAISKISDLFMVTLLIYLVSSGIMLFSLSSLLGRWISLSLSFSLSNLYFLLNLGNFVFTQSKPLYPILFHCILVKWEKCFFWPVKCSNGFLDTRLQYGNWFLAVYFEGP